MQQNANKDIDAAMARVEARAPNMQDIQIAEMGERIKTGHLRVKNLVRFMGYAHKTKQEILAKLQEIENSFVAA